MPSEKIKDLPYESYLDMSNTTYPRGVFFVKNGGRLIGVDNRDGRVVDAEFKYADICRVWLRGRLR